MGKRVFTAANKAIARARFAKESTNPARDIARKGKFPKSIGAYHPNRNDWPGVDTPGSALPGAAASKPRVTGKRKRSKSRSRSRPAGPKKPRKKRAKKATKKAGKKGKGKRTKRTGPPRPLSDEQKAWHAHVKATQARIGGSYRNAMKEASKTYSKGFKQNIVSRDKDAALYAKVMALKERARRDPEALTDEEHLFLIQNWPEAEDNRTIQEMFTPAQRAAMDAQPVVPVPRAIASLPVNPPKSILKPVTQLVPRLNDPLINKKLTREELNQFRVRRIVAANKSLEDYRQTFGIPAGGREGRQVKFPSGAHPTRIRGNHHRDQVVYI